MVILLNQHTRNYLFNALSTRKGLNLSQCNVINTSSYQVNGVNRKKNQGGCKHSFSKDLYVLRDYIK